MKNQINNEEIPKKNEDVALPPILKRKVEYNFPKNKNKNICLPTINEKKNQEIKLNKTIPPLLSSFSEKTIKSSNLNSDFKNEYEQLNTQKITQLLKNETFEYSKGNDSAKEYSNDKINEFNRLQKNNYNIGKKDENQASISFIMNQLDNKSNLKSELKYQKLMNGQNQRFQELNTEEKMKILTSENIQFRKELKKFNNFMNLILQKLKPSIS